MALTTVLSLLLIASVGFFAHRASICMVRSVAEVFSTGRAYMLLSFLKTIVWVIALGIPLTWLFGPPTAGQTIFPLHVGVLLGGFVFGLGSAINGGCSISTVTRLGDGEFGMLFALLGIALGALGTVAASAALDWPSGSPPSFDAPLARPTLIAFVLLVPLWIWTAAETARMWQNRPAELSLRNLLLTDRWSLSAASALIGSVAAILCVFQGAWMYGGAIRDLGGALFSGYAVPRASLALFFVTLVAGAVLSGVLRRTYRPRWPQVGDIRRHLLGGFLMGTGVALIPGGNAALMLHGLPGLSPHAAPGLLAIVAGIATAFLVTRLMNGSVPMVDCTGDVCRHRELGIPADAGGGLGSSASEHRNEDIPFAS